MWIMFKLREMLAVLLGMFLSVIRSLLRLRSAEPEEEVEPEVPTPTVPPIRELPPSWSPCLTSASYYTPPLTPPTRLTPDTQVGSAPEAEGWTWPSNSPRKRRSPSPTVTKPDFIKPSSSSVASPGVKAPSTSSPRPEVSKAVPRTEVSKHVPKVPKPIPVAETSNFVSTYQKNPAKEYLVTAYDVEQIGRLFLLAYNAEGFMDLLDALTENVTEFDAVLVVPPVGTKVVARVGLNGDERDEHHILEKLGGIYSKPWRGIIKEQFGEGRNDEKALITFTDLGITEEIDVSDIFIPSKKVASIPLDQFSSWIQIDNTNISEDKRRFYRSTYRSLFAEPLLSNNVLVKKIHANHKGEVKAIITLPTGLEISSVLEEFQQWEYEKAIKRCSNKTAAALMEEMHGRRPRIKFDDISQPRCLNLGTRYEGVITAFFEEVDGLALFEVLGGGDTEDDKRIWLHHVNNYYALTHSDQTSPFWYPQIGDVFLLRTEVEVSGIKGQKEKRIIWRRVARENVAELWDVDDREFTVVLNELPSNWQMIPAPKELLDLPNGAVRIRIPELKLNSGLTGEEALFKEKCAVKILSYDEQHLAHLVDLDPEFIERAIMEGWMLNKNGF